MAGDKGARGDKADDKSEEYDLESVRGTLLTSHDDDDENSGGNTSSKTLFSDGRRRRPFSLLHYLLLLSLACMAVVWWAFPTAAAEPDFPADEVPSWDPKLPVVLSGWRSSTTTRYDPKQDIPNIAHFVRQINRHPDGSAKPFHVEFRHLLSYYSSSHFLRPEAIYFWTDAPADVLEEARQHGDKFTQAFFRIPNLHIQPVHFPNTTMTGVPIELFAHKSDFVRTRVMAKMGGMYFDDDAWVLRDLAPFRMAGFDNVFSLDDGARIAQACWLSKPRNRLMIAFARLQEKLFNGEWLRASGDLVTALMRQYARVAANRSSLVLEKDAFYPGHWEGEGLNDYYEVHDKDDVNTFLEPSYDENPFDAFDFDKEWGWRRDWRRSWVVHGFSNELRKRQAGWMFKEFKAFTPAYVLSKRSNIARALFPALQSMIDTGFLLLDEADMRPPPA